MTVFIDTSAFYAVLDADDDNYSTAEKIWNFALEKDVHFVSHNYILIETIALLQNRIGLESVHTFEQDILPVIGVHWIGQETHQRGMSALLTASRRRLSLVDCISFEIMREKEITVFFAFDDHFSEQGFELLAAR